jgi:spore germination cell wall hydrolase CwlJ-like protein
MKKINFFRIFTSITLVVLGFFLTNTSDRYFLLSDAPESVEEVVKVAKKVDPKQLACLAKNIFYEAGGEPILGQAAVARVVLNRITHGFGSNPCNVIYQATTVQQENDEGEMKKIKLCQFSWVCEGKSDPNKNSPRYQQATQIAYEVLAYDAYNDIVPNSTLFFHNLSVHPSWPYQQAQKIGNHIFYSKAKKKINNDHQQKP